jgi:hypothetical protein
MPAHIHRGTLQSVLTVMSWFEMFETLKLQPDAFRGQGPVVFQCVGKTWSTTHLTCEESDLGRFDS